MRDGERDGHASRAPDAALDGHVREARRNEERDARFGEIAARGDEASCDAIRGLVEIVIREDAVGCDDGESVGRDDLL